MAAETKTLGQTYYEEVEALKGGGTSNADAIRAVAKKHGKNENAIRGGIHQYKTKQSGGTSSPARARRQSAASSTDLVASARQALEDALGLVDKEVDEAKAALDAAQARYDQAVAEAKERKTDIERKLKAWSS